MPTTEIAGYPLVADSDISDPGNEAAIQMKKCVETVLQQDGVQSFHFGMQTERPQILEALITYDNIDKHHAWTKHPQYRSTNEQVGKIFAGPGYMYYVDFAPFDNFLKALECPVTEIATFYFLEEPPADYLDAFYGFREAAEEEKNCWLLASAGAVTYEDLEDDGAKGKAVVFIAEWQSLEVHKDFQQTSTYKLHMPQLTKRIEKVEAPCVVPTSLVATTTKPITSHNARRPGAQQRPCYVCVSSEL